MMVDQPLQALVYACYKSGSTALFQAIRGRMAGAVHEIFEPASLEFFDEPFQGPVCAKIISSLEVDWAELKCQLPGLFPIVLVRDPRDVIVSALFFRPQHQSLNAWRDEERLHALHARLQTKLNHPTSTSLLEVFEYPFTQKDLSAWMTTNYGRLESALKSGAREVRYDDLMENRLEELWKELGLPLEPLGSDDRWSHVPRTKRSGNWRRWLNEADVDWLREAVDPVLAQWPWMSNNWTLEANPKLTRAESVEYIRRTVNLRRIQAGMTEWK